MRASTRPCSCSWAASRASSTGSARSPTPGRCRRSRARACPTSTQSACASASGARRRTPGCSTTRATTTPPAGSDGNCEESGGRPARQIFDAANTRAIGRGTQYRDMLQLIVEAARSAPKGAERCRSAPAVGDEPARLRRGASGPEGAVAGLGFHGRPHGGGGHAHPQQGAGRRRNGARSRAVPAHQRHPAAQPHRLHLDRSHQPVAHRYQRPQLRRRVLSVDEERRRPHRHRQHRVHQRLPLASGRRTPALHAPDPQRRRQFELPRRASSSTRCRASSSSSRISATIPSTPSASRSPSSRPMRPSRFSFSRPPHERADRSAPSTAGSCRSTTSAPIRTSCRRSASSPSDSASCPSTSSTPRGS